MDTAVDKVEVGILEKVAYVRVQGRGTFKVGPSLKQFGLMAVEQGCRSICVEMQQCVGMDSTFMGILASLSVSLRKSGGEVVLRGASEKNQFLLKMLGLQPLVRIEEVPASVSEVDTHSLDAGSDKHQMTETMISAHESLIEVAPDNLVKFKDVLAYLKEDLKRVDPASAGSPSPRHD